MLARLFLSIIIPSVKPEGNDSIYLPIRTELVWLNKFMPYWEHHQLCIYAFADKSQLHTFFAADKENDPYQEKEKRKKSGIPSVNWPLKHWGISYTKGFWINNKFSFHKYFSSGELSNYKFSQGSKLNYNPLFKSQQQLKLLFRNYVKHQMEIIIIPKINDL